MEREQFNEEVWNANGKGVRRLSHQEKSRNLVLDHFVECFTVYSQHSNKNKSQ